MKITIELEVNGEKLRLLPEQAKEILDAFSIFTGCQITYTRPYTYYISDRGLDIVDRSSIAI